MMDDEIGSGGAQIDPSSISLFSAPPPTLVQSTSSYGDERTYSQLSGSTQAFSKESIEHQTHGAAGNEKMSYIKYAQQAQRKAQLAAANRRNVIERFERLKGGPGLNFTIPQFSQLTMGQLGRFLGKMRRPQHGENRSLISTTMLDKLFPNETTEGNSSKAASKGTTRDKEQSQIDRTTFPSMAQNELKAFAEEERRLTGRTRFIGPPIFTDDEATEEEDSDYEDDDLYGPKTEHSAELYDLLQQKQQILAADKHAKRMQEEIAKKLAQTEAYLENLEENFVFEKPPETGNPEEDSMSCARCRPILIKNSRPLLVKHDLKKSTKSSSPLRPIISNKRCGPEEYAHADQSIHPLLSLPSAISMDMQLQKYLHVSSFVPSEIEMRRHKMAQLVSSTAGKNLSRKFYNLAEDTREEGHSGWRLNTAAGAGDHANKAIRLSLRKTIMKRGRGRPAKMASTYSLEEFSELRAGDSAGEDDDKNDPSFAMPQAMAKKRRRMTLDHHPVKKLSNASKPSKLEGRRMSHVEYGASMFDYDSQLMDIGLPLPAIQKVENVDIDIPSFRRQPAAALDNFPSNAACQFCQTANVVGDDHWAEIRRLHRDLEAQERQQRFPKKQGHPQIHAEKENNDWERHF